MIGTETATIYVNGGPGMRGTLRVEQDVQRVPSNLPRPNPRWEFTDAKGHYHAYADDKRDRYPTLEALTEPAACDGSCGGVCNGEGYHVTRYFCRICREEIEPGVLHGPHSLDIPGPTSWGLELEGAVPMGEKVSIRLKHGAQPELFGIAEAVQREHRRDVDGPLATITRLVGVGPLGQRTR